MVSTVLHYFPEFNSWIVEIKDLRFEPSITYSKQFLIWAGVMFFVCKLGSRRQMDYEFGGGPQFLHNINRLAGTKQTTCPVNKTLDYFLGKIDDAALPELRRKAVNRLIRMKVLEVSRHRGRYLVLVDGSGFLTFKHKHCKHCLTRRHGDSTTYAHQVLEAKVLGPGNTVFSIGTEFIDNRDVADLPSRKKLTADQIKQDCELKAMRRLATHLRADFPQLKTCLVGDALYACGEGFQIAKDHRCDFIYTFKEGRTPALWDNFRKLLPLCPEQQVELTTAGGHQVYQWVTLPYKDSEDRDWSFTGIQLKETNADGEESNWSWVTSLEVNRQTVVGIANGGRSRWRIENEGFNIQKTSDLNMEHIYSNKHWMEYYFLLQIAHMILQLIEKGSLLSRLAKECGRQSVMKLFGSLKNIARRLLESLRNLHWPDDAFDVEQAKRIQIRLNSS